MGAEQFGKLNMFAMIKELLNKDCPILPFNGVPVNGASGTYAGKAGIGAQIINYASGVLYVNTGTKAAPNWQQYSVSGNISNFTIRTRVTTAQANAGLTPVVPSPGAGRALRLIDAMMIAIGGAAATATSVRLTGTRGTSAVQLYVQPVAGLGQSVVARPAAAATVQADGASFTLLDANTPILQTVDNNNLATATAIDNIVTFAVEGV